MPHYHRPKSIYRQMSRIIVLVKYAKPKKDYLAEASIEEEEDISGLDRKTRLRLGLETAEDEEDAKLGVEGKLEKMFDAKNLEFYYKPYGVHTNEIHDFYPLDDNHTIIISEFGGILPIKIGWKDWLSLWEKHSGEAIFVVNEEGLSNMK